MDFSKLKGLVPVKKANINRDSTNRTRSKTSNMTPHAIKCEVFFYDNKFYGIVDNERYPIDITDEDYQKATFAFSTPDNEHWDWFTIRPFSAAEADIENGLIGCLTGGFTASAAGVCASVVFAVLWSLLFKSKEKQ